MQFSLYFLVKTPILVGFYRYHSVITRYLMCIELIKEVTFV